MNKDTQDKIRKTLKIFAHHFKTFCECDICYEDRKAILDRAIIAITKIIEEEKRK